MIAPTPNSRLRQITDKVEAGERLTFDEGVFLDEQVDVLTLGRLANIVRERKNGNLAFYNTNIHLNPTNVCVYRCTFCAFRADLREARGYVMGDEQILARGQEAVDAGSTEMHIVGGLHHQKDYDWYLNIIRLLHDHHPSLHLKAWTPVEINWFCHLTKRSVRDIIVELKDAGLGSLPGGGAEILVDRVRKQIAALKASTDEWLGVMRDAHRLGLRTSATMMFGHVETLDDRIEHLERVRGQQDRSGGFTAFIAWTFQAENTKLKAPAAGAHEYLRMQALSRIYLDNIPNVQSSWVTQGLEIGQVALQYGANDLGSIMIEENVVSQAGTTFRMEVGDMKRLISELGYEPRQRDNWYRLVG